MRFAWAHQQAQERTQRAFSGSPGYPDPIGPTREALGIPSLSREELTEWIEFLNEIAARARMMMAANPGQVEGILVGALTEAATTGLLAERDALQDAIRAEHRA